MKYLISGLASALLTTAALSAAPPTGDPGHALGALAPALAR